MTRRDDIVATLERAADPRIPLNATDCALLRALADALREGQERGPAQFNPWGGEVSCVWIIPEPKVKP